MKKPILAVLTQSIRRDNQKPLKYFKKIEVRHFYKSAPYNEMTEDELTGAIQYKNMADLKSKLLEIKPDIIQGAEPYGSKEMFFLSNLAYDLSRSQKIPLIFPCWENRPIKEKFGFIKRIIAEWFMRKYVRESNKIFYLNEGARKNLIADGADPKKMVKFLWGTWGVDVDEFTPLRAKNYQSKFKNLLFVGRLDEAKGIEYLLEAFKIVYKKMPNIKLTVIGDGHLKNSILEFRSNNFLENKIILKGIVKNKDLPNYFQEADLTILPSVTLDNWEEQVGMTNLQSMASGVPVVSTKSGAIPEYVPDMKAGILVQERNSQALADAIIKLMEDDTMRKEMAEFARNYSVTNYNAKLNIDRAENIILDILNNE